MHKCDCTSGVCTNAPSTVDKGGRRRVKRIKGEDPDLCPYTFLRCWYWAAIVDLHAASLVSPLANWPDAYPSGLVCGVIALKGAMAAQAAKESQENADKQARGARGRMTGHRRGR